MKEQREGKKTEYLCCCANFGRRRPSTAFFSSLRRLSEEFLVRKAAGFIMRVEIRIGWRRRLGDRELKLGDIHNHCKLSEQNPPSSHARNKSSNTTPSTKSGLATSAARVRDMEEVVIILGADCWEVWFLIEVYIFVKEILYIYKIFLKFIYDCN